MYGTKTCRITLFTLLAAFAPAIVASELEPQQVQRDGVTVKVEPQQIDATATEWQFAIALDTHSGELDDALLQASRLIDSNGGQHAPISWDGDAAGGHHRKGLLRFAPLRPMPATLTLQIQRAGEAEPRVFQWSLQ